VHQGIRVGLEPSNPKMGFLVKEIADRSEAAGDMLEVV
jgi:hypothetical protein